MPPVSNSSPLILLAGIGRFELLHDIYGEILVPEGVWQETVVAGSGQIGSIEVGLLSWIWRQPSPSQDIVAKLAATLGPGEAEAIALATTLGSSIPILLDDRRARQIAVEAGLSVTGTAGVLVEAKLRGHIQMFAPLLSELREAGLYLSETAAVRLIELSGES